MGVTKHRAASTAAPPSAPGSTYTRAGIRILGPAPRPMDTMPLTLLPDDSVRVDTSTIRRGGTDNAQRAVMRDA